MVSKKSLKVSDFKRAGRDRRVETKNVRYYYLIVCEGTKTEPLYFKALVKQLPIGVLSVCEFDIEGLGTNTADLVTKAQELAKKARHKTGRKVDKIWCVFDRDSFPKKNFNGAINTCNQTVEMEAAWTNEAFELWYLLHFNYVDSALSRKQYGNKLSEALSAASKNKLLYKKNNPENHHLMTTLGSQELAIKFALRLEHKYGSDLDYSSHNPRTTVHKLILEIFGLEEGL